MCNTWPNVQNGRGVKGTDVLFYLDLVARLVVVKRGFTCFTCYTCKASLLVKKLLKISRGSPWNVNSRQNGRVPKTFLMCTTHDNRNQIVAAIVSFVGLILLFVFVTIYLNIFYDCHIVSK